MKGFVVLFLTVVVAAMFLSADALAQSDRLSEALGEVGFTRADLGYRPKGYWSRYPDPNRVPHKLHFFDSLFAEPLRTYDFTKVMARATADLLTAEKFASKDNSLYRLAYFLGIEHKVGGFRGYGANLDPQLTRTDPLLNAIRDAYTQAGQTLRIVSFGKKVDWPDPEGELAKQIEGLDGELERAIAALVANLVDAHRWRTLALRNVDPADVRAVFVMRSFHGHSTDGQSYPHQVDDVAAVLDEPSLYYAAQKALQAAHDVARTVQTLVAEDRDRYASIQLDLATPFGRIVVGGTGDDTHNADGCAAIVDLGGNDTYTGAVGATGSLEVPISIAVDIGGDDTYRCDDADTLSQGAAIFGAGVLIDLAGNDSYTAKQGAQGYGLFGMGVVADYGGDDSYRVEYSGQGAAYFGIGLCLDASGNDRYDLYGDGQGFGGPGGVGVLASGDGDDIYRAEPLAEKAGRADYHSKMKIAVNQAQGCGAGMRADGSHGHAWAGGLGTLIDLAGNDTYESGNWSIGTGYWYGTGLLYDGAGDDLYRSVYFTQASGAHFCIGAIFDEGGDDRHVLYETGGAGIAFGWDFTVAMLVDKGGNDYYEAKMISIGCAQIRSNAMLIDLGGDDTYAMAAGGQCFGASTFRKSYAEPSYSYGPYSLYGNSVGLLLDIGGTDQYLDRNLKNDTTAPNPRAGNDKTWFSPARDSKQYGYRSFGVGMDVADGTVDDFTGGATR